MAFKKINRIKRKKDLDLIFKKGKTVKGAFLFIKYIRGGSSRSRVAIIVPARIFTKATQRNRIKRVLSSIIHPTLTQMDGKSMAVTVHKLGSEEDYIDDVLAIIKNIN